MLELAIGAFVGAFGTKTGECLFDAIKNFVNNKTPNSAEAKATRNLAESIAIIGSDLEKSGHAPNGDDYQEYFDKHFRETSAFFRAFTEGGPDETLRLLRTLFERQLLADYTDDSLYVTFIDIIQKLSPLEVRILDAFYRFLCNAGAWGTAKAPETELKIDKAKMADELNVNEIIIDASLLNLERFQLITTFHPARNIFVGGNPGVNKGAPSLTALGVLFIEACVAPL